jgi:hypothetical protein
MMTSQEPPPSEAQSDRRRHWGVALAMSLVLGGLLFWLMRAGALPVLPAREAFADMKWWVPVLFTVGWVSVLTIRSLRWWWLLSPVMRVPLSQVLAVAFMGNAAIALFPFRMGEVVRPAMIRARTGISGWAATGTVAAERIIDGLVSSLLLLVALLLAPPHDQLPDHIGELRVPAAIIPTAAFSAVGVFGGAFAMIGLFYWRRDWAEWLVLNTVGRVWRQGGEALAKALERVAAGLRFLPSWRHSVPFLLLTVAYWGIYVLSLWAAGAGVGLADFGPARAATMLTVMGLGLLLPAAPGLFGTFQVSAYAALILYYPVAEVVGRGAALVFLVYVIQIGTGLLLGLVGLLWRPRSRVATGHPNALQ